MKYLELGTTQILRKIYGMCLFLQNMTERPLKVQILTYQQFVLTGHTKLKGSKNAVFRGILKNYLEFS